MHLPGDINNRVYIRNTLHTPHKALNVHITRRCGMIASFGAKKKSLNTILLKFYFSTSIQHKQNAIDPIQR